MSLSASLSCAWPARAGSQRKISSTEPSLKRLPTVLGVDVPITQVVSWRPASRTARPMPGGTLSYAPGRRIPVKRVAVLRVEDGMPSLFRDVTPR